MTEEKKTLSHETSEALCKAFEELVRQGQVTFPLTQEGRNKLDSIVKTVNSHYFGIERFPQLQEKAAAYFCLIIKDHPVTDGNKRLATLWLQIFCDECQLKLVPKLPIDILAVSVENDKVSELRELVEVLRKLLFKVSSPQTIALATALNNAGVESILEHWDGHKNVDIFIPESGMYIEVEGLQHFTDPKQIISDLYRDYYSDKEKRYTFRITNQLVDTHLEEISKAIVEVVKNKNK